MSESTLLHKHGGVIESITAIEHETYRGVASWHFRGRVLWRDKTVSPSLEIAPHAIAHDDSAESQERVRVLMRQLHEYLEREGEWHEAKHKRDGRVYNWTPKKPKGSFAIALLLSLCMLFGSKPTTAGEQPAPTYHAVVMYMQPYGAGYTYTVGPMSAAQCDEALPQVVRVTGEAVDPSMIKRMAQCVATVQVPMAMAGWNCNAVSSEAMPQKNLRGAKFWTFACYAAR